MGQRHSAPSLWTLAVFSFPDARGGFVYSLIIMVRVCVLTTKSLWDQQTVDSQIGKYQSTFSSAATFAIILVQSPICDCLNKRAVGYHGLSSRSVIQR